MVYPSYSHEHRAASIASFTLPGTSREECCIPNPQYVHALDFANNTFLVLEGLGLRAFAKFFEKNRSFRFHWQTHEIGDAM